MIKLNLGRGPLLHHSPERNTRTDLVGLAKVSVRPYVIICEVCIPTVIVFFFHLDLMVVEHPS